MDLDHSNVGKNVMEKLKKCKTDVTDDDDNGSNNESKEGGKKRKKENEDDYDDDKDHELVLSLDANEDITEDINFKSFFDEDDRIDVYKHLHLDSHPVTYLRGNKWLDYFYITLGLIPALRAA
eukprot:10214537-Ditylum_brightwellii.AAC.1